MSVKSLHLRSLVVREKCEDKEKYLANPKDLFTRLKEETAVLLNKKSTPEEQSNHE